MWNGIGFFGILAISGILWDSGFLKRIFEGFWRILREFNVKWDWILRDSCDFRDFMGILWDSGFLQDFFLGGGEQDRAIMQDWKESARNELIDWRGFSTFLIVAAVKALGCSLSTSLLCDPRRRYGTSFSRQRHQFFVYSKGNGKKGGENHNGIWVSLTQMRSFLRSMNYLWRYEGSQWILGDSWDLKNSLWIFEDLWKL